MGMQVMSQNDTIKKATPVIRDKDFAKRLETAIYGHSQAPHGHGRQKWVRERMEARFGDKVSPEAVRKWFSGEARPRPKLMARLAQVLEVDEAWLSLGLKPDSTPEQKRQHNAAVSGAVNLIAGMMQMNGGHIAFPDERQGNLDMYAIIGGRQHSILVRAAREIDGNTNLIIPVDHEKSVVLIVFQQSPTSFAIARLPSSMIAASGVSKGGYIELSIQRSASTYLVGADALPMIMSFDDLDGERPIRRKP